MTPTCPKCGAAGLVVESLALPDVTHPGTTRGLLIVRCNRAGCCAAIGAATDVNPQLDAISAKLDRLARKP